MSELTAEECAQIAETFAIADRERAARHDCDITALLLRERAYGSQAVADAIRKQAGVAADNVYPYHGVGVCTYTDGAPD